MRYLSFLIIVLLSYVVVNSLLEGKSSPENREIVQNPQKMWPAHWVLEDHLFERQHYLHLYSPNSPEEELTISLKHFEKLGYDAEGAGDEKTRNALVRVSGTKTKLLITIQPDEEGGRGSSINVLILPKSRKENL